MKSKKRKTIGQRVPEIFKRKPSVRIRGLALTRLGRFFKVKKYR